MSQKSAKELADKWEYMDGMLYKKVFDWSEMHPILLDTYRILHSCHKDELVSKDVCRLISAMDGFFQDAVMLSSGDQKTLEYYNALKLVAFWIKDDFLNETFEYEFPKLKMYDVIDLENCSLKDLMR